MDTRLENIARRLKGLFRRDPGRSSPAFKIPQDPIQLEVHRLIHAPCPSRESEETWLTEEELRAEFSRLGGKLPPRFFPGTVWQFIAAMYCESPSLLGLRGLTATFTSLTTYMAPLLAYLGCNGYFGSMPKRLAMGVSHGDWCILVDYRYNHKTVQLHTLRRILETMFEQDILELPMLTTTSAEKGTAKLQAVIALDRLKSL